MPRFAPTRTLTVTVARLVLLTLVSSYSVSAEAQVVGPNVNMAGGPASFTPPSTIIGDPFLQRQNEPSIAVSSRNPCHLLAGANDYRFVDVEIEAGEVGDAWLGVFKSFDCGATWSSTLLPGHKLDSSGDGLSSPINGLGAAADPTVRAGTSGLFYYSGIAFNRGDNGIGKVFVSRFIDNNNKDGGDPIEYAGNVVIDVGTSGQFLDKPWLVADIPRGNLNCVVNGRSVPAGAVYLVYTSFVGGSNNIHSKIMFSRSDDCGAHWTQPSKLSESVARNQGTTIAVDPGTGAIHVAWREFAVAGTTNSRNSIMVARSTDGGQTFTKAVPVAPGGYTLDPFDQASSALTFRTNAYPTLAIVPAEADGRAAGQPGRIYLAWAARGFGGVRPTDARIMMTTSIGGAAWSAPKVADSYGDPGHQIMPALAFSGGKLALAYYDLRDDHAGEFEDLVMEWGYQAYLDCLGMSPGATFGNVVLCMVNRPNTITRRHTLDMRAAMADSECLSAGTCGFASTSVLGDSTKVSRYVEGRGQKGTGPKQQLQYNRPNLPLFSGGKFPFIGDYIDITGQSFVPTDGGGWAWNSGRTANRPAPVFHVSWSDNRNVGTPRDGNWQHYTPAVLGPAAVMCAPGQVGIRNQDVYTAQLRPDLVVATPQNSKRISGFQRSFAVVAQNTTDTDRTYRMRVNPPAGVVASFDQFSGFNGTSLPNSEIQVRIPRKSSASRTVFVGLIASPADPNQAPDVLVPVTVEEVVASGNADSDFVYINPDFENPDFENPDFENAELHNPDFENPDFENPDFENPDFENFTLTANSTIRNPDFENPDFENPDFENPDFENPDFENPDFENPDFENPDFENPDFENPDFENPDFENPDFENGAFEVADTTFPVRNNGNTTSAYKTNIFVNDPPAGVKYQLAIRKIFVSPAAVCAVDGTAAQTAQSIELVNLVGPNVQSNPFDRNFNDPSRENATFTLGPGERGVITLRAYCPVGASCPPGMLEASLKGKIALGVVAQGANCARCAGGQCTNSDLIGSFTECVVTGGPPKDIYDPIPPTIAVVNPTLISPETTIVQNDTDNNGTESVNFAVDAHDNVQLSAVNCVAPSTTITFLGFSGDRYQFRATFPVGETGVTCTASDVRATPAPNTATAIFVIKVKDVTPPSFNLDGVNPGAPFLPSNPAEATSPAGAKVDYTNPTASDSNGGPVTVVCESPTHQQSGSVFSIGSTPINCTATDVSGVSTPPTNLFTINVADTTAPSITLNGPASVTIATNGTFTDPGATASDLVAGSVTVTSTNNIVASVPGSYTVTYTAKDSSGNTATATRTVIVADTVAPVVTLNGPSPMTVEGGTTFVDPGATAVDNVSGVLPVTITGPVNTNALGTYTRTYSATDAAGNTAFKTRSITVVDTKPPVVTEDANPATLLWSPNKTMTPVTVSGVVTDLTATTVTYKVIDEYGQVQPAGSVTVGAGGAYSFIVKLEAYRNGNDADGRIYTIQVKATDAGGRSTTTVSYVKVPHNQ